MGFYSEVLFPWGMNLAMSGKAFKEQRRAVLQSVDGKILEIGFGSGLNLPHYPPRIKELVAVDPNAGMSRYTEKQIANSEINVDCQVLSGESLPMKDDSFDTVVSTWTLCSIRDVAKALSEVKRVLKPGGHFIFLEHGLSPDKKVSCWQNRLNKLQTIIGDGCNLNRDMQELVSAAGFNQLQVENFYFPKAPRFLGYMYKGIATK